MGVSSNVFDDILIEETCPPEENTGDVGYPNPAPLQHYFRSPKTLVTNMKRPTNGVRATLCPLTTTKLHQAVICAGLLSLQTSIASAGVNTTRIANVSGGTPGTYYQYLAKEVRDVALPVTYTMSVQFNNGLTANPLTHFVHGCDAGDVTVTYTAGALATREVTLTLNAGAAGKNPVISFVNANTLTLNNDACRVVCNGKDTASFEELQAVEDAMDYGKHTKASSNSAYNIQGSNKLIDGAIGGLYPGYRSSTNSLSTVEPPSGTYPYRNEWVFIDLGEQYEITQIVLGGSTTGSTTLPKKYRIRVATQMADEPAGTSTTDLTSPTSWYGWQTIRDVTDGDTISDATELGSVSARYLKLEMYEGYPTTTQYAIQEVEVYGTSGWTSFPPSTDSKVIYVSTSGLDTNDGLSEASPVQTLNKAFSFTRQGYPDQVLLKRGDVWQDENLNGLKPGRSATEPSVVSYYGGTGARPQLRVSGAALNKDNPGFSHIAIIGLHLVKYTMDPNDPGYTGENGKTHTLIRHIAKDSYNFLIEDCVLHFGELGLGFIDMSYNVTVRRNIIVDGWNQNSSTTNQHTCGIYICKADGILIEENLFDHNGWNEQVPGAGRNMYAHNMYLQTTNIGNNATVRGNIVARGASAGIQQRMGGLNEDNLAVGNSTGIGPVGGSSQLQPTICYAFNNVILEGMRQDPFDGDTVQTTAVWGLSLGDTVTNDYQAIGNIVANRKQSGGNIGITYGGLGIWEDNIQFAWGAGTGDMWDPRWVDPNRSVGSYHGTLGQTPTLEAFLESARSRGLREWPAEYTSYAVNQYIREGFATTSTPTALLPDGLTAQDIGAVTVAGTSVYTASSGIFTLEGEGSQINATADNCHFAGQAIVGDCTLYAKIVYNEVTHNAAKAGLMIRETLDANSKMVNVAICGNINDGTKLQVRSTTGATSTDTKLTGDGGKRPILLKLVRSGNSFSAYCTPDFSTYGAPINGLNWKQVGTTQTVSMSQTVYVGMCVSSNSPGVLSTAAFDEFFIEN